MEIDCIHMGKAGEIQAMSLVGMVSKDPDGHWRESIIIPINTPNRTVDGALQQCGENGGLQGH